MTDQDLNTQPKPDGVVDTSESLQPVTSAGSITEVAPKKRLPVKNIVPILIVVVSLALGAYLFLLKKDKDPQTALNNAISNLISPGSVNTKIEIHGRPEGVPPFELNFALDQDQPGLMMTAGANLSSIVPGAGEVQINSIYLKDRLFLKLDGVDSIATVLEAYFAGAGLATGATPDVDAIKKAISGIGDWVYFDKEVAKEIANLTDSPFDESSLPDLNLSSYILGSDFEKLSSIYSDNPFLIVDSSSEEVVEGEDLLKLDVHLDKSKAEAFTEAVKSAQFESELFKRLSSSIQPPTDEEIADFKLDGIWITKDGGQVRQISTDESSDGVTLTFTKYGESLVVEPAGAKPADKDTAGGIWSALGISTIVGVQSSARDAERRTDINAIYSQLEAYAAKNRGIYPTMENIADPAWVSQNLVGLDAEALVDPSGGGYLYTPTAGCNNTTLNCGGFTLSVTLEDGSEYSKNSLQ